MRSSHAAVNLVVYRANLVVRIFENIKYSSEHFPEGALNYLGDIVEWAAEEGFYIVLDLHDDAFLRSSLPGRLMCSAKLSLSRH